MREREREVKRAREEGNARRKREALIRIAALIVEWAPEFDECVLVWIEKNAEFGLPEAEFTVDGVFYDFGGG